MLLYKKITVLCCTAFLLAGVGGYTADAAINTEVGSLSGMPLPAPKKSETGKKIILNLASRLLTLYEGTEKVRIYPVAVGRTRHGLSAAVYLTAVSVCMKKMWRNFLKVCPWEHPWKSSMTV